MIERNCRSEEKRKKGNRGWKKKEKEREYINIKGEIYIHTEGDEKENRNTEEEGSCE